MGSYTDFYLKVYRAGSRQEVGLDDPDLATFVDVFNDSDIRPFIDKHGEMICEEVKWYYYDDDMQELSDHFTGFIFVLEGHPDNESPPWRYYYWDGKVQGGNAQIIFPESSWLKGNNG